MKIVAFIQARMGSTRLPGKVLMDLAGSPMLARVVNRCRRAATLDAVVVATTMEDADDAIETLCSELQCPCFRGSEADVLDRYYQAALQYKADIVVRITSDCPLIDPEIIDLAVEKFLEDGQVDYLCNDLPYRTYPRGLDVEVISFSALDKAWREDDNLSWREHVTQYIFRHPEKFRSRGLTNSTDLSSMRWTVDTPEDFALVQRVYEYFRTDHFSWRQVLYLIEQHPEWLEINRHVLQKDVTDCR